MSDADLVLSRVLEAPRKLVWSLWTDPVHLARSWGPAGFTVKVAKLDLRVGGVLHYTQTPPGGQPLWGKFTYDEIQPTERLVFRSSFSNEGGETVCNPWNAAWPLEIQNTLTLTESEGKTTLTLVGRPHNASAESVAVFAENKANVQKGFTGTFAQLEAYVAQALVADRALSVRRTFDAPRQLVWKAWTDPVQIQKWWGPQHFTCPGATIDLKIGGTYLLGMKGPDGQEFWGTGEYKQIILNQKLVYTDNFCDAQGRIVSAASMRLPDDWKDMTLSGWSSSFDKLDALFPAQQL